MSPNSVYYNPGTDDNVHCGLFIMGYLLCYGYYLDAEFRNEFLAVYREKQGLFHIGLRKSGTKMEALVIVAGVNVLLLDDSWLTISLL